ncbi:Protein argonaute-3, partial [Zancudomyces culisetae]
FRAALAQQPARVEIIQNLSSIVRDLLRDFYRSTNYKPQRIIFYRDGVSEGQFNTVLRSEVDAIYQACDSLEKGYKPAITFVVVQKRHKTKLFPMGSGDDTSDRSGNCLPGTVVDSTITSPYLFDFYLQSHSGIQGTSKPVHYYVLKDDNNFTTDEIQSLSYNLCYLYAICTRSVSIVPPVYYAHRVAYRARSHTRDDWGTASDTASISSGNVGTGANAPQTPSKVVPIHERLQRTMYFM